MLVGLLLGCVSITALLCLLDWGTMGLRPADESTACTVAACVSPSFGLQLCFCWPWQVCSCLISVFMSSPLVNTELNTAGLMLFWPASNVHGFFSVMVMTLEPSEGWHLKCPWLWGVSWRPGLYGIYSWNFDERVWSLGKNLIHGPNPYPVWLRRVVPYLQSGICWVLVYSERQISRGTQEKQGWTSLTPVFCLCLFVLPVQAVNSPELGQSLSHFFSFIPGCFFGKKKIELLVKNVTISNCSGLKVAFTGNITN